MTHEASTTSLVLPLTASPTPLRAAATQPTLDAPIDLRRTLREYEVALITGALRSTQGNQRLAAALLKLPLRTLERKLRMFGIRVRRAGSIRALVQE